MSFVELFFIAVGLSMDAFAVSICLGLNMEKVTTKKLFIVGLYFGTFQAVMPLIGFLVAALFTAKIVAFDHWIAFGLLCFLGGKMMVGSLKKEDGEQPCKKETSISHMVMFPLAVATSIDALAVGVSLAFLRVSIIPAVSFIGVTTFIISVLGVRIGYIFGVKCKSKAEFIGGVILVLIGIKILLEHLDIISF